MSKQIGLRTLQRWFSLVMQHASAADVAVASRAASALVAQRRVRAREVVRGSLRMTPTDQLQIYNGAYLARLVEVMQADYGAVMHKVGEAAFRDLVARYLVAHPSRHPNLNQLGRRFPSFLARQGSLPHRAFLAELATLELAVCVAFDAPEFRALAPADLARLPAERWGSARFVANPSVQLLVFRYPVDAFYQAWKNGQPSTVPGRSASWLCVYRKDDRAWRQRLEQPAHAVLSALLAGRALSQALRLAGGAKKVNEWFQAFARNGFFTTVAFDPARPATKREPTRA